MDFIALDGTAAYKVNLELIDNYKEAFNQMVVVPDGLVIGVDDDSALFYGSERYTYVRRIRHLQIRASYSLRCEDGVSMFYPKFTDGISAVRTFEIPDCMPLFHINRFKANDAGSYSVYLCAITTHGVYLPPLPNLGNNGGCCTGDLPIERSAQEQSIKSKEAIYKAWEANRWNTDLWRGEIEEYCHEFFRQDMDGNAIEPTLDIEVLQSIAPPYGSALTDAIRGYFL